MRKKECYQTNSSLYTSHIENHHYNHEKWMKKIQQNQAHNLFLTQDYMGKNIPQQLNLDLWYNYSNQIKTICFHSFDAPFQKK